MWAVCQDLRTLPIVKSVFSPSQYSFLFSSSESLIANCERRTGKEEAHSLGSESRHSDHELTIIFTAFKFTRIPTLITRADALLRRNCYLLLQRRSSELLHPRFLSFSPSDL